MTAKDIDMRRRRCCSFCNHSENTCPDVDTMLCLIARYRISQLLVSGPAPRTGSSFSPVIVFAESVLSLYCR